MDRMSTVSEVSTWKQGARSRNNKKIVANTYVPMLRCFPLRARDNSNWRVIYLPVPCYGTDIVPISFTIDFDPVYSIPSLLTGRPKAKTAYSRPVDPEWPSKLWRTQVDPGWPSKLWRTQGLTLSSQLQSSRCKHCYATLPRMSGKGTHNFIGLLEPTNNLRNKSKNWSLGRRSHVKSTSIWCSSVCLNWCIPPESQLSGDQETDLLSCKSYNQIISHIRTEWIW